MSKATPGRGIEYQKTVTVDGEDYKVHLLSPTPALEHSVWLTKRMGAPIATMAQAAGQENSLEAMAIAIQSVCGALDKSEVIPFVKEMVKTVTYENKSITFEQHFHGRLGHLLKLLSKIMEVQFADFFEAIGQLFADAKEKQAA